MDCNLLIFKSTTGVIISFGSSFKILNIILKSSKLIDLIIIFFVFFFLLFFLIVSSSVSKSTKSSPSIPSSPVGSS